MRGNLRTRDQEQ